MCGRFELHSPSDRIERLLKIDHANNHFGEIQPSYNVPPGVTIPIVAMGKDGQIRMDGARWGLIPSWTKSLASFKATTSNATCERVMTAPMYRDSIRRHRCLSVCDGFYEWDRTDPKHKIPHLFTRRDGEIMLMAAIFSFWRHPEGEWLTSTSIITTASNEDMMIHDRMPLILSIEEATTWIDRGLDEADIESFLHPPEPAILTNYIVDSRVGSTRNDDPSLIEPIDQNGWSTNTNLPQGVTQPTL